MARSFAFSASLDLSNRYCIECTHEICWDCIVLYEIDFICCYCKQKRGWVYVQRNLTFH